MEDNNLVRVNKYSKKIKELPIFKRINIDYPLLCRDKVAEKLAVVVCNLPVNVFLQIDSAYRTPKTQKILWKLRNKIMLGLVHNPNNGQSPHCTGVAVDVSLLDVNGKEINLSEPFIKYYEEPQIISNRITSKAQELRIILNKAMLSAGFAPNAREYWHFSYGDKGWGEYTKRAIIYPEIVIDSNQYYSFYLRIYYRVLKRLWKFTNKILKLQTNY